jgi:glucose/arabinose dehydrogenase
VNLSTFARRGVACPAASMYGMTGRVTVTRRTALGALVGAAAGGFGVYGAAGRAAGVGGSAPRVRTVATGLRIPWGLAFLPDGTALVTERGNDVPLPVIVTTTPLPGDPPPVPTIDHGIPRILAVTGAGAVREVQRLPEVSTDPGECGLLGIAVSPHYARDRWVYVCYSTQVDYRVARLRLGHSPQPILTGLPITPPPDADPDPGGGPTLGGRFHPGGRIAFGPDGMLYVTTGDTWVNREIAQDPDSLGGKILRITPEGRPAPGNPIAGSPVWSLGHRDPQGLAWDARGRLYAAEFGEDRFDELNLIRRGGNYGWPLVEGVGTDPRFIDPITTWAPADASPSGIAIAGGRIYVACLRGRRLYRVGLDGRGAEALLTDDYGRLRTVERAPDGSLWVLTSNRDGRAGPTEVTAEDDRILRFMP